MKRWKWPDSVTTRNSMDQIASVRRQTFGPLNPLGTPTAGPVTTHNITCRAWEDRQQEITSDGKWFTLSRWKMRVPLDADIREDDQVLLGDTLLEVETPPIVRHGHKLVTLEILQRDVA